MSDQLLAGYKESVVIGGIGTCLSPLPTAQIQRPADTQLIDPLPTAAGGGIGEPYPFFVRS